MNWWGVGVVLVGCLRTPHHAQTLANKGAPRDFGGEVGCFRKKRFNYAKSFSHNYPSIYAKLMSK